jgi:hypothetical protein
MNERMDTLIRLLDHNHIILMEYLRGLAGMVNGAHKAILWLYFFVVLNTIMLLFLVLR